MITLLSDPKAFYARITLLNNTWSSDCMGNNDKVIHRKAKVAGVSTKWIRAYSEVLETPGWNFLEEIEIHDVFTTTVKREQLELE